MISYNMVNNRPCPFCPEQREAVLEEGKFCFVAPARAPYTEDHLLIIPKRHLIFFHELSPEELEEFMIVMQRRSAKLHTRHEAINLLLRDSTIEGKIGKSVDHLHFHLLPTLSVDTKHSQPDRKFFSDLEYLAELERIKSLFCA